MAKQPVNWGLIGYGGIARHHAKAATNAPGAKLICACDIKPEREKVLREDNYDIPFYPSQEAMFKAHPELEAVSVCTYSGVHYQGAVAAAKRGIHVLSEKPLDVTLAHMDKMIEAADKAGTKLACIFQRRTAELNQLAKKAIEQGLLGKMILGDSYQKYYRAPAYYKRADWRGTWKLDGGGALMNQGVHGIDLLLWLMGDVESVFSYCGTFARDIEVEDTSVSVVRFKNGAFGNIVGTTSVVPGRPAETHIHGDKGSIILTGKGMQCHIAKVVKDQHEVQEVDLAKRLGRKKKSPAPAAKPGEDNVASDPTALTSDGHTIQIQDLCDAIRKNREPMVPGKDARRAVELILAIYKSRKTKKEVKLPL